MAKDKNMALGIHSTGWAKGLQGAHPLLGVRMPMQQMASTGGSSSDLSVSSHESSSVIWLSLGLLICQLKIKFFAQTSLQVSPEELKRP